MDELTKGQVRYGIELLPERHRAAIRWRFGIAGPALMQKEVGERLGISPQRVYQIEREAMGLLWWSSTRGRPARGNQKNVGAREYEAGGSALVDVLLDLGVGPLNGKRARCL